MQPFENYQSPFSWRYGSPEMRALWSERNKRLTWRRLWAAMAEAQAALGVVSAEQAADLRAHMTDVDVARALELEKELRHDLMAEIRVYAEQCPLGGAVLHLGATSMDIKDNAEVLQMREALDLLLPKLAALLRALADKMDLYAGLPVMAYTHLQPAEPTTLGYRLAAYAQDFLADHQALAALRAGLKGKGFKGAVGNAASYVQLYGREGFAAFEASLSQALDLPFFDVATQTYTRRQDYVLLSALAGLGAGAHKLALDLRLLQMEPLGEAAEPFGAAQVGSSAMPFKRNPVEAEKVCSLARALAAAPQTAWHNQAESALERTLDDSANRRTLIPEAFLAADELLMTLERIISGLRVNETRAAHNLALYGPFAALERVLLAAAAKGADRQAMHETLRKLSLKGWQAVQQGGENPLAGLVRADAEVARWLGADELSKLFNLAGYTGVAEERALVMAASVLHALTEK